MNEVRFTNMDQVQKFVDDIRKIPYDVNACHGKYIVDAKSLLGLLSLSLGRPIQLEVVCNDDNLSIANEILTSICEDYK